METKNIIKITVIIKKITFIIFFLLIKYLKLKVLLALKWQFRWRPGATLEEGLMINLNCHFKNFLNFFFWIFLSCYSHFFKITSAVPLGLYLIPQDAFSFVFLHFLGIQTVLSRRKSLPVYRRIFTTFKCTEDLSQSFTFSLIFESLLLLLFFFRFFFVGTATAN